MKALPYFASGFAWFCIFNCMAQIASLLAGFLAVAWLVYRSEKRRKDES